MLKIGLNPEGIITITEPDRLHGRSQSVSNVRGHLLKNGGGEGR